MAKTNDEIMDDLAKDMDELAQELTDHGMFGGRKTWNVDVRRTIFMVEAFQRGEDLTMTKLAYTDDAMADLETRDVVTRMTAAWSFGTGWQHKRAA